MDEDNFKWDPELSPKSKFVTSPLESENCHHIINFDSINNKKMAVHCLKDEKTEADQGKELQVTSSATNKDDNQQVDDFEEVVHCEKRNTVDFTAIKKEIPLEEGHLTENVDWSDSKESDKEMCGKSNTDSSAVKEELVKDEESSSESDEYEPSICDDESDNNHGKSKTASKDYYGSLSDNESDDSYDIFKREEEESKKLAQMDFKPFTNYEGAHERNMARGRHQIATGEYIPSPDDDKKRDENIKKGFLISPEERKERERYALKGAVRLMHISKVLMSYFQKGKEHKIDSAEVILRYAINYCYSPMMIVYAYPFVEVVVELCYYKYDRKIRRLARRCYERFKPLFGIPEGKTFMKVFQEEVRKKYLCSFEVGHHWASCSSTEKRGVGCL